MHVTENQIQTKSFFESRMPPIHLKLNSFYVIVRFRPQPLFTSSLTNELTIARSCILVEIGTQSLKLERRK